MSSGSPRKDAWLAGGIIGAAIVAAYFNSLHTPFVLDDEASILENPSLRSLASAWLPPNTAGVGGRPLLNFCFALNRTLGGDSPVSFHVGNILIHIAAALVLFGLVRRTLDLSAQLTRLRSSSWLIASVVAGWWALHPVQTASVTYVSQRAESLMGLCYLGMLYCLVRSASLNASNAWRWFAIGICAAGMAVKEVMVTAPIMALLYDRIFLAGSWAEAWRRRRVLYLGLAGTWLLLGALMATSQLHARGVGFERGVGSLDYALVAAQAVGRYLWVAIWPVRLVFDYGVEFGHGAGLRAVGAVVLVLALLGGTVLAVLKQKSVAAFAGAWFLVILAPTTSFVPVAMQPAAENRLYLPLAAIIVAGALCTPRWSGRWFGVIGILVAAALGAMTWQRNQDYRSLVALWTDTVSKVPGNARAHANLGHALIREDRAALALPHLEAALRIAPNHLEARVNLAAALAKLGNFAAALQEGEHALRLAPRMPTALFNVAFSLASLGRNVEALPYLDAALASKPDYASALYAKGLCLLNLGRAADAVPCFEAALRLQPDNVDSENNLAGACFRLGDYARALRHYENTAARRPDNAEFQRNIGSTLLRLGRPAEAVERFRHSLKLEPQSSDGHAYLGFALAQTNRKAEAVAEVEAALRLKPDNEFARGTLGRIKADASAAPPQN